MKHEVTTDGRVLWVNSSKTSSNLARFSSMGIDIHHDVEKQINGEHCLFCKDGPEPMNRIALRSEYDLFKTKLLEHHGVKIPKRVEARLKLR